jgi:NADH-ubiquinone oxidoreductase chain 2
MFYIKKPFILLAISTLFLSTLIALSRTNWLFLWMAIELNLLRFIPIINNTKTSQETEATIKYFLAQRLGSSILLMASLSIWYSININFIILILFISIILKLGAAPLHFWYPSVITSISWTSCILLSTWQKLAPLIISIFIIKPYIINFIYIVAALNALIGGIIGINQTHIRTIIAYSSITHIGWMLRLLNSLKPTFTIFYFIFYSLIITPIFLIFNKISLTNNNQIRKIHSISPLIQFLIPLILISLSGLPPLTGFIPKWITISLLIEIRVITTLILIFGALINIFFYLNIIFYSLIRQYKTSFYTTLFKNKQNLIIILIRLLTIILPPLIL